MDLASIAGTLTRLGAPILGGALGGPAGAAIASSVVEALAKGFDVEPTPEAVGKALEKNEAPIVVQRVEAAEAPAVMEAVNEFIAAEIARADAAQAAEIEKGFGAWQFWRGAWQAMVIGGWLAILITALFGGNLGAKTLMPVPDVVTAWGSVTLAWLAVFNGGHVLKEIAPTIGFRKAGK
jgi:alkylation response protein AidB-like acyl-CoA dehydrogenase